MGTRGQGFAVTCPGCDTEFTSLGLRCCSQECERTNRERQETIKEAARIGREAKPKRTCEFCGKRIPRYTATDRTTKVLSQVPENGKNRGPGTLIAERGFCTD
jgi:hypothetical protein